MEEGGMSCPIWLLSDFYILFSLKSNRTPRRRSKVKPDLSGFQFWGPRA